MPLADNAINSKVAVVCENAYGIDYISNNSQGASDFAACLLLDIILFYPPEHQSDLDFLGDIDFDSSYMIYTPKIYTTYLLLPTLNSDNMAIITYTNFINPIVTFNIEQKNNLYQRLNTATKVDSSSKIIRLDGKSIGESVETFSSAIFKNN